MKLLMTIILAAVTYAPASALADEHSIVCMAQCVNTLMSATVEASGKNMEDALHNLQTAADKHCGRDSVIATSMDLKARKFDFDINKACLKN